MSIKGTILPWAVVHSELRPNKALLFLPGRDQWGHVPLSLYDGEQLSDVLLVGITPENREWYPRPNGANDQSASLEGQRKSLRTIQSVVERIKTVYGIMPEDLGLVGVSAGGVMAIQAAVHLPYEFACVVIHSGAILEPEALPLCSKSTPFLLIHSHDDPIFSWDERYLPMKEALTRQGYPVHVCERATGGHKGLMEDFEVGKGFVAMALQGVVSYVAPGSEPTPREEATGQEAHPRGG